MVSTMHTLHLHVRLILCITVSGWMAANRLPGLVAMDQACGDVTLSDPVRSGRASRPGTAEAGGS
jgi:hypothetical protein